MTMVPGVTLATGFPAELVRKGGPGAGRPGDTGSHLDRQTESTEEMSRLPSCFGDGSCFLFSHYLIVDNRFSFVLCLSPCHACLTSLNSEYILTKSFDFTKSFFYVPFIFLNIN